MTSHLRTPATVTILGGSVLFMLLAVLSCFVPVLGFFAGAVFGLVALAFIIVAMAGGDQRGLALLLCHMFLTTLGCFFTTVTSRGTSLGPGSAALQPAARPTPAALYASTPGEENYSRTVSSFLNENSRTGWLMEDADLRVKDGPDRQPSHR